MRRERAVGGLLGSAITRTVHGGPHVTGAASSSRGGASVTGAAPRLDASHTPAHAPTHEVLDDAAHALGIPRVNTKAGFVAPLSPLDNEREHRCVAAAMVMASTLRAIMQADDRTRHVLRRSGNGPSVADAYHTQRVKECEETHRCDCGPMCGGLCDNCGSVAEVMVRVFREGVALERDWPLSESRNETFAKAARDRRAFLKDRPFYRVVNSEWVPLRRDMTPVVASLEDYAMRGIPVVVNLSMFANQDAWMGEQSRCRRGADCYEDCHRMPAPSGTTMPLGHAVLLVGCDEKRRRFHMRNSFGSDWGYHGDFCIAYDDLKREGLQSMIAVLEVSLENVSDL